MVRQIPLRWVCALCSIVNNYFVCFICTVVPSIKISLCARFNQSFSFPQLHLKSLTPQTTSQLLKQKMPHSPAWLLADPGQQLHGSDYQTLLCCNHHQEISVLWNRRSERGRGAATYPSLAYNPLILVTMFVWLWMRLALLQNKPLSQWMVR